MGLSIQGNNKKSGKINFKTLERLLVNINTNEQIICNKENVSHYLKCIQWNLNLYTGISVNNFIPNYRSINIKSIVNNFPKNISFVNGKDTNWLHPDTYLLLLMPVTGKEFLPDRLKLLMEVNSPIKDLFPEPCLECIEFKNKLKSVKKPSEDSTEEILKYRNLISQINCSYSNHIEESHPITDLPIERIQKEVDKL